MRVSSILWDSETKKIIYEKVFKIFSAQIHCKIIVNTLAEEQLRKALLKKAWQIVRYSIWDEQVTVVGYSGYISGLCSKRKLII